MMTRKQLEMARHALGLPNKENMSYRNHYCVAKGGDGYEDWQDMVKQSLAVSASGGANWVGDFFYLTKKGAVAALDPGELLSPEDWAKMQWPEKRGQTKP